VSHRIKPYIILYDTMRLTLDLVERVVPDDEQVALRSFLRNALKVFERTIEGAEEGKPVAGLHFAFAGEILYAFDVVPFIIEAVPYLMASLMPDGAEYFYDRITAFGLPYHSCTSQKGIMGMMLDGLVDLDFIVCPTAPCDNTVSLYQFFMNRAKIPLLVTDLPPTKTERSYEYFAGELMRQMNDIRALINQEPDFEKFKGAIENSREAHKYLIEINEMRRKIPSPIESIVAPIITATTILLPGTPEKTQIFKDIRDLMQRRIKHGEARNGFERFRSIWPNIAFFFDMGFYEWMDREIGMSFLMDCTNNYYFEPIDPAGKGFEEVFYELAQQVTNAPMTRQSLHFLDTIIEDALWAAKTYQADCAIFTAHLGCKQVASAIQLVREALRDQLGIPMLALECDIGDKRFTSVDAIKHEVEEFVKTLL
jgi:benzoyl-CoA reductase/2-hydroxyglutaryl-CoA dehydratase subunit BcrC/BadD/HgdB